MADGLTGAAPSLVDCNGGAPCVLTGTFVAGRAYRAYVGTDATGTPCYSGVSGQAALCSASSATALPIVLPEVTPGDVPLFVVDTVTGAAQAGSAIVRAEAPFLCSMTYAMRRDIRSILDVGETDPAQLPDAEPVPGFVPQ